MRRLYITGTDTDVGKTHVTGALAGALRKAGDNPTVVKIVQTGISAGVPGDAHTAASAAGCPALELHRFDLPADAWNAALAAGVPPLRADTLTAEIRNIPGSIVVEGSGGAATPLNQTESISDAVRGCELETIIVVGLRLGCISHALLTLEYLRTRYMPIRGMILCEHTRLPEQEYTRQVQRALRAHAPLLGIAAFQDTTIDASAWLRG
jgi:dethiobiotin synthetase